MDGQVTPTLTQQPALMYNRVSARPASSTEAEERVRRLLEKLAARAGIQELRLYVVDSPVPNAFAAGMRPAESSVVVTEGLMKLLDDREMEGVLAHEISHIAN